MLNNNMLKGIKLLVYTNKDKQDIAKELNVTRETISRWVGMDEFQEELRKEMNKGFNSLALKARRRLEELIDSKNDIVALGACKEVLNKAGYKEVDRVDASLKNDITIEIEGKD